MNAEPEDNITVSTLVGKDAIDAMRDFESKHAEEQEFQFPRLAAHRWQWLESLQNGLGHTPLLLKAEASSKTVGTLPLMLVKGPLFGRFLVGLPYVNTGGLWCESDFVGNHLVTAACEQADEFKVKYLELRHENALNHPKFNFKRTDKVHMRLTLPDHIETFKASLKSKVRSQVNKSLGAELDIEFGTHNQLPDFYTVFAENMRDLGTPVFSRQLFQSILNSFGDDAELCVVRHSGTPVAGALLVHVGGVTEVPSASCIRRYNSMNANMRMYWHLLERAIERKSHTFDFGRSSVGSGTHKFKKQWGSLPVDTHWQYYVRDGDPESMRPDAGGKQRLVEAWKRLPIWLTKLIGPSIVRGIP